MPESGTYETFHSLACKGAPARFEKLLSFLSRSTPLPGSFAS